MTISSNQSNHQSNLSPTLRAAHQAKQLSATKNRKMVAEGLATGWTPRDLADALKLPLGTVNNISKQITVELQLGSIPDLPGRLALSVMTYKAIQKAAWKIANDPELPPTAQNRVAALAVVQAAQQQIDRLEGTSAPDSISTKAMAEFTKLVLETLEEVEPTLRILVLQRLAQKAGHTGMGVMIGGAGGGLALSAADTQVVESDYLDSGDPRFEDEE